jgi:hypothetical protein
LRIRVSSLVFWFSFKGNWSDLKFVSVRRSRKQASLRGPPSSILDRRRRQRSCQRARRARRSIYASFRESGVKGRAGGCGICARRFKIAT